MSGVHDGIYRKLFAAARAQGWRIEFTGGTHLRFVPPSKSMKIVYTSGTPGSRRRAFENLRAELRRAGLVIP